MFFTQLFVPVERCVQEGLCDDVERRWCWVGSVVRGYESTTRLNLGEFRLSGLALPVTGTVVLPYGLRQVLAGIDLVADRPAFNRRVTAHLAEQSH